jgi:hypothetical protein
MAFFKFRKRDIRMRIGEMRRLCEEDQREFLEHQERLGRLALDPYLRVREAQLFTEADIAWLREVRIVLD